MLLNFFKKNLPSTLFILPIIGLVLWSGNYLSTTETPSISSPLYELVNLPLLKTLPRLSSILALGLLIIQSFIFNKIINNHYLLPKETYTPAITYLLLMSMDKSLLTLHPVLLANTFIIFALKRLLESYKLKNAFSNIFDASLLLSISSLFYKPTFALLPVLIISIYTFRPIIWREFAILILGIITPYVFVQSFYFLTNTPYSLLFKTFFQTNDFTAFHFSYYYVTSLAIALFITILSLFKQKKTLDGVAQKTIKGNKLLFWTLAFCVLSAVVHFEFTPLNICIISIPTAFLMASLFTTIKKTVYSELLFFLFVASVLTNLIAEYF